MLSNRCEAESSKQRGNQVWVCYCNQSHEYYYEACWSTLHTCVCTHTQHWYFHICAHTYTCTHTHTHTQVTCSCSIGSHMQYKSKGAMQGFLSKQACVQVQTGLLCFFLCFFSWCRHVFMKANLVAPTSSAERNSSS